MIRSFWLCLGLFLLACSTSSDDPEDRRQSFCEAQCIDADQERCMAWASQKSPAYVEAYAECGDQPSCLTTKLNEAGPDADHRVYAKDYCAACPHEGCEETFFDEGNPGALLLDRGGAGLDALRERCLTEIEAAEQSGVFGGLACGSTHSLCSAQLTLDELKDNNGVLCRAKR